jgi:hypothetical protein
VEGLGDLENELRAGGASDEEIAQQLYQARRDIGVQYKALTPEPKLSEIYARNLAKYGDPLGPSFQSLLDSGKSYQDIIESAQRPGGQDLGF